MATLEVTRLVPVNTRDGIDTRKKDLIVARNDKLECMPIHRGYYSCEEVSGLLAEMTAGCQMKAAGGRFPTNLSEVVERALDVSGVPGWAEFWVDYAMRSAPKKKLRIKAPQVIYCECDEIAVKKHKNTWLCEECAFDLFTMERTCYCGHYGADVVNGECTHCAAPAANMCECDDCLRVDDDLNCCDICHVDLQPQEEILGGLCCSCHDKEHQARIERAEKAMKMRRRR